MTLVIWWNLVRYNQLGGLSNVAGESVSLWTWTIAPALAVLNGWGWPLWEQVSMGKWSGIIACVSGDYMTIPN